MEKVQIFWDPAGFALDSLDTIEISGVLFHKDTPCAHTSICMLGTDSPEIHYTGNTSPSDQHRHLQVLAGWIEQDLAPIHDDIATYFMRGGIYG